MSARISPGASTRNGWWGEGEIKFYLDGDTDYPTICGTGTEDYFGGAWNFDVPGKGYTEFSHAVPRHAPGHPSPTGSTTANSDSACIAGTFPTRSTSPNGSESIFRHWAGESGGRYLPLHDDIASTALFYLDQPMTTRPQLPDVDFLAIPGDPAAPK